MQPLDLLLIALAVWRLSYFLVREDAPFKLMKRFREKHPTWGVFSCVYCASIWMAAFTLLLWHIPYLDMLIYLFAISGAALMLASFSGANHPPQTG